VYTTPLLSKFPVRKYSQKISLDAESLSKFSQISKIKHLNYAASSVDNQPIICTVAYNGGSAESIVAYLKQ